MRTLGNLALSRSEYDAVRDAGRAEWFRVRSSLRLASPLEQPPPRERGRIVLSQTAGLGGGLVQQQAFDFGSAARGAVGAFQDEVADDGGTFFSRTDSPTQQQSAFGDVPYLALVRSLVEGDKIEAARKLLAVALRRAPAARELLKVADVLAPARVESVSRTDRERSQEYSWLKRNAAAYAGRWVAVDGEQLVASASTLKELLEQIRQLNRSHPPLVHRLP